MSKQWRIERRRRGVVRHTSEVRLETLPAEVQELLLEMASTIARINSELIEIRRDLSDLQALEIDKRLLKGAAA